MAEFNQKINTMKTAGTILLIVGLVLTIFTSISFFTKEKVVDIGKLEINKEEPHKVAWSPIIGVLVMATGGILLWQSKK